MKAGKNSEKEGKNRNRIENQRESVKERDVSGL